MHKKWMGWVVGCALSLAAASAFADAFAGPNPTSGKLIFGSGDFSDGSVGATISGGVTDSPSAGQLYGSFYTGSSPDPDDYLRFFCIDIYDWADTGSASDYTRNILGNPGNPVSVSPTQLLLLTRLFDEYYPDKAAGTYYDGGQTGFGDFLDPNQNIQSAAFQIVIWQIFFGTGSSSNADVQTDVTNMLNFINGEVGPAPGGWTFYTFTSDSRNPKYQDYLSANWSQPLLETPEPNILLLLCSAMVAAGAVALRRRQTA